MGSKVQAVTNDLRSFTGSDSREQGFRISIAATRMRRATFWIIVAVAGFLQAWAHRLLIDHDAVAYLDVAENYARGAWGAALNGFYSPMYSWLIAIPFYIFKTPRSGNSIVLHLVNFAGYLGAYASFEFFLGQLIRKESGVTGAADSSEAEGLSEIAWHTLGLGLFLYTSLYMANVSGHSGQGDPGSTPDIFVMLAVFLAAGFLIRIQTGEAKAGTYAALGAVLAFGYLVKTVMFPLSFVFMAVAGLLALRNRKNAWAFLLTPVFFALVAGPWITVLSHAKGRFAYGDAGNLTYRWLVGPHENPVEWGGQTQEGENLTHPPRMLYNDPPVYEFATPMPGTFPLWYGSSYWLDGWKLKFSWAGQKRILHESYSTYWEMLNYQKEYLVLWLALLFLQGTVLFYFKNFLRQWALWLPALAGLGMYALVRVEPRYVAAFIVVLWMSLFAAVKFPKKELVQQFALCAVFAAVLTTGLGVLHGSANDFHTILRHAPSEQAEVAEGLRKLGVREGQTLATIGIPRDSFYWARLASVRVVSEIPSPNVNQYWQASQDTQEKVRSAFARSGAVAIVTDTMPAQVVLPESSRTATLPGWEQIGTTSYYLYPLQMAASPDGGGADSGPTPN